MNPEDIIYLNPEETERLYQQLHAARERKELRSLRLHAEGNGTVKWKINEWCWEPAWGRKETQRVW